MTDEELRKLISAEIEGSKPPLRKRLRQYVVAAATGGWAMLCVVWGLAQQACRTGEDHP